MKHVPAITFVTGFIGIMNLLVANGNLWMYATGIVLVIISILDWIDR
jgi:hypothetical protein